MSNPQQPGSVPPRPSGVPPSRPVGTPPPRPQGTPPPRPATGAPGAPLRQPVDLATRLDGQRGWLNEIDNSLKKRSIVALVLTCLAVGVAAAAMYIAITKNSDSDRITALETRITALEAASGAASTGTTDLGVPIPDTGATGTTTPSGATGATTGTPSE
jgi:hypothetical protein